MGLNMNDYLAIIKETFPELDIQDFSVLGKGGKYSKVWDRGYNKETHESFIENRGLYDLGQWDGSDFFMVHGGIIITERVMKLMKANKVTAVEYEKLSDLVDFIGEPRLPIR